MNKESKYLRELDKEYSHLISLLNLTFKEGDLFDKRKIDLIYQLNQVLDDYRNNLTNEDE